MTTPASGEITLLDLKAEFGGQAVPGLQHYYRGGGIIPDHPRFEKVPLHGEISLQDFYDLEKLEFVFRVADKVYDGTTNAEALDLVYFDGSKVVPLDGDIRFPNKQSGQSQARATNLRARDNPDDYDFSGRQIISDNVAVISKKPIHLSSENADKFYDGSANVLTTRLRVILEGIIDGDDVGYTYRGAQYDDSRVGGRPAVRKMINFTGFILTGSDSSNYELPDEHSVAGGIRGVEYAIVGKSGNFITIGDNGLNGRISGAGAWVGASGNSSDNGSISVVREYRSSSTLTAIVMGTPSNLPAANTTINTLISATSDPEVGDWRPASNAISHGNGNYIWLDGVDIGNGNYSAQLSSGVSDHYWTALSTSSTTRLLGAHTVVIR